MNKGPMALGLVLLAVVGCGDGAPPLVAVHGQVTLDGKPLIGKTVKFIPDAGTLGQGAGASTDQEGRYTLLAVRPGATRDMQGAPAGAYRVVVTEPLFPIDMPVQNASDTVPIPAIGLPKVAAQKKQVIPLAYGNSDTTPLRVEVPNIGGAIDLRLLTPSNAKK